MLMYALSAHCNIFNCLCGFQYGQYNGQNYSVRHEEKHLDAKDTDR